MSAPDAVAVTGIGMTDLSRRDITPEQLAHQAVSVALLAGPSVATAASAPHIVGVVARSGNGSIDYHDRLAETARVAWDTFGFGPDDVDCVELHDATSAEELYSLECLGFFEPGAAGPGFVGIAAIAGGR
jgi:hypothetical protein